jgi:hypothetical protein
LFYCDNLSNSQADSWIVLAHFILAIVSNLQELQPGGFS